jgi:hypothetical protein
MQNALNPATMLELITWLNVAGIRGASPDSGCLVAGEERTAMDGALARACRQPQGCGQSRGRGVLSQVCGSRPTLHCGSYVGGESAAGGV